MARLTNIKTTALGLKEDAKKCNVSYRGFALIIINKMISVRTWAHNQMFNIRKGTEKGEKGKREKKKMLFS